MKNDGTILIVHNGWNSKMNQVCLSIIEFKNSLKILFKNLTKMTKTATQKFLKNVPNSIIHHRRNSTINWIKADFQECKPLIMDEIQELMRNTFQEFMMFQELSKAARIGQGCIKKNFWSWMKYKNLPKPNVKNDEETFFMKWRWNDSRVLANNVFWTWVGELRFFNEIFINKVVSAKHIQQGF